MTDPYVTHRDLLFTVAYEMLGSAADAEDVVQDVWLRWRDLDRTAIAHPRAYLVRITTRLALNQLRTQSRRRESYVGPWLPEPLLTSDDVAEDVELADAASLAMLVVLDSLGPVERAVFVLREVFGYDHAEIAEAVDRSPGAVRQIAHRAREHVRQRRPAPRHTERHDEVMRQFVAAANGGDLQALMDLLAPDVVLLTDGGGRVKAALQPIHGVDKVLRFLSAVRPDDAVFEVGRANGGPALLLWRAGVLDTVTTMRLGEDRISELHVVRNPDKLTAMTGEPLRLTR